MKLRLSALSVLHHVSSNLDASLLIVLTTSSKPNICSADSKLVFVKDGAARIRLGG